MTQEHVCIAVTYRMVHNHWASVRNIRTFASPLFRVMPTLSSRLPREYIMSSIQNRESLIEELVSCYPHTPTSRITTCIPKFEHRIALVDSWNIMVGSRVLDIGCGQGECSLVLAAFSGHLGTVRGVDPAPLDYGEHAVFHVYRVGAKTL